MRRIYQHATTISFAKSVVVSVLVLFALISLACLASAEPAVDAATETAAERGYRFLVEKAYLPPDFDQEAFDNLWQVWPQELKEQAESATIEERRKMAFRRYGLTTRPHDDSGKPMQYVVDDQGQWAMNCLVCHGGNVLGEPSPGRPNFNYDLQTLTEEMRLAKLLIKKPLTRMEVGSLVMPLSGNRGLTNAVNFGVGLMAFRDKDLNVHRDRPLPKMIHHDLDPPPWWNFSKRKQLYIDAYSEKSVRGLMQFMMVLENGPEDFQAWESDFEDVFAFLTSLSPPEYPFEIDQELAARGKTVFNDTCARCHGTYGSDRGSHTDDEYPELVINIDEVGTDRVRLDSLNAEQRKGYHESWFASYGADKIVHEPVGYVAPPLDGIWASGPYFHNGSVPTLWHVLHPDERPAIWRRLPNADVELDEERVGLPVESLKQKPPAFPRYRRRSVYVTSDFGKSAAGHDYPNELTEVERAAVLEYLKTL